MKNNNEWIFETEENEDFDDDAPGEEPRRQPFQFTYKTILFLLLLFAISAGFFLVRQARLSDTALDLEEMIQDHLDLERYAVLTGDGELFLSLQEDDPAWFSKRLNPDNIALIRNGFEVGRITKVDEVLIAHIRFESEGETLERTGFYHIENEQVTQLGSGPPSYWGAQWQEDFSWGTILFFSIDRDYLEDISRFVNDTIVEVCSSDCLEDKMPFVLVVGKDFRRTAAPITRQVPSPRLVGLDEKGKPSNLFWELLRKNIVSQITPAHIRFAVPPLDINNPPELPLLNYQQAADLFMEANPDIIVEIIMLPEIPDDVAELALNYDGAAVVPNEEMLAAGLVRDLSDYMDTDPSHDLFDYYGQILVGSRWQGRFWWVPQAANMVVVFYDRGLYSKAGLPEPSLNWTWEDLEEDIRVLKEVWPEVREFQWGFGDKNLDAIYSYAYNWGLDCTEIATIYCSNTLESIKVVSALDWYRKMVIDEQVMPDFSTLTEEERENTFLQIQSARREIAIWVDRPINYEYQLLLLSIGVVPFPGSLDYEGITPLTVYGSFISQSSERPLAVWKWLNYLSFQKPAFLRLIPARPSVARDMKFWINLPPRLSEAMRAAFPYAQPVIVHEQNRLSWEMIHSVLTGELTSAEAVEQTPALIWFKQEQ